MAFRFRKFRSSLRLIPSTKSLGFSTRVNEGDQAKGSPTQELSSSSKLESQGQCDASTVALQVQGKNLFPLTRSISLPGALQSVDLPLKRHGAAIVPLPQAEDSSQHTVNDLEELLLNTAKPVAFTCDDILADSGDCCGGKYPADVKWERATVNVIWPPSQFNNCQANPTETAPKNSHNIFSRIHSNYRSLSIYSSDEREKLLYNNHTADLNDFNTFLFSTPSPQENLNYSNNSSNSSNKNTSDAPRDGPSPEQLHDARVRLEKSIPTMFTRRYDYSLLHKNVIFENNLFGANTVQRGVTAYALELLKLRFKFYARYTSTNTEVLSVTTQEQNGVIRIHWRLRGLPQTQVLKFWRLFQNRKEIDKDDWEWTEAFSYFHIGKDGLVHKHRIDRMLPDGEEPNKLKQRLTKLLNPAKPLVS